MIGKAGNTAKAIRILLRVVGMKNNARINLKINEPAVPFGRRATDRPQKDLDEALEGLNLE